MPAKEIFYKNATRFFFYHKGNSRMFKPIVEKAETNDIKHFNANIWKDNISCATIKCNWWRVPHITLGGLLQISFSSFTVSVSLFSSCGLTVGVWFSCVWGVFFLFLEEWYWLTACMTSEAVHCWWIRASFKVKGPSLVRRTPLHIAVLRSSSPISCTILRKYFWVSFRQWTSVTEKNSRQQQYINVTFVLLVDQLKTTHLKWSWEAGSEYNASLSK